MGDKPLSRSDRPKITITGDGCRGSEERRGAESPNAASFARSKQLLAQITGSSLQISAYTRGQFPDYRPQTKRQEQYRDQTRSSIRPVLR